MRKYIAKRIQVLKTALKSKLGFSVNVHNIGWNGALQKRVLVSYLTDALKSEVSVFKYNTNRQECLVIISNLIKQGCVVDVVSCTDERFDSNTQYDYIIGFGVPYRAAKLKEGGKRVLYCTEKHPDFSFKEERKRIDFLFDRHGVKWEVQRSGRYYLENDYLIADEFIVMGVNTADFIKEKYGLLGDKLHKIEPTAIKVEVEHTKKSRRGFLWLGSNGVIHKGLDLLLESFLLADLDSELHICGAKKKDVSFLGSALDDPRIIFHGKVDVNSNYFESILGKVQFIVLPSCSEGVATSVLTGMGCGLIPIVTDACDIETAEVGFRLEAVDIESMAGVLKLAFFEESSSIKKLSINSIERINNNSISVFDNRIGKILERVL